MGIILYITDQLLEFLGIDRVYQDKRTNKRYIVTKENDTVFLFDVDDCTGKSDGKISISNFQRYFDDITVSFYKDILQRYMGV